MQPEKDSNQGPPARKASSLSVELPGRLHLLTPIFCLHTVTYAKIREKLLTLVLRCQKENNLADRTADVHAYMYSKLVDRQTAERTVRMPTLCHQVQDLLM